MRLFGKLLCAVVLAFLISSCSADEGEGNSTPAEVTTVADPVGAPTPAPAPIPAPTPDHPQAVECRKELPSGAVLLPGESLCTDDGKGVLVNTGDDLILFEARRVVWSLKSQLSNSQKATIQGKLTVIMQRDCNLVAYDEAGKAVWSSGSFGGGRDNCRARVVTAKGRANSGVTSLAIAIQRDDSALPLRGSGASPVAQVWDSLNGVVLFDSTNLSLEPVQLKQGKSRFAPVGQFASCQPFDLNKAAPGVKIPRSDRKILLRSFTAQRSDRTDGRYRYICLDLLDQDYGDIERHCFEYDRDAGEHGQLTKLTSFDPALVHNVDPNKPQEWKWQTCSKRYNGVSIWNANKTWAKGVPDDGPEDYFCLQQWETKTLDGAGPTKITTPGEALLYLSLGESVSDTDTCAKALARTNQFQKIVGDVTKLWCPGGKNPVGAAALGALCKELGTIVAVGIQTIGTGLFSYFQNAEAGESQGDLDTFRLARVTFEPRHAFNVYACYLAWKPGFQPLAPAVELPEAERQDTCDAQPVDDQEGTESDNSTNSDIGTDSDGEYPDGAFVSITKGT